MMSKNTRVTPEQKTPEGEPNAIALNLSRAAQQNTLRNIGLIIEHEYKKRLTQRSFIISTIIILVLIVLGSCVPTVIEYITATSTSQTKVVVVNDAGLIANMNDDGLLRYIDTSLNGTPQGQNSSGKPHFSINVEPAGNSGNLQKQVKDGTLNILLVLDRAPNQDLRFTYYTSAGPLKDSNATQVQVLANQLSLLDRSAHLGLTPDQTSRLFTQPEFTTVNVGQAQNNRSVSDLVAGYIVTYAGIVLIFMSLSLWLHGGNRGRGRKRQPHHGDSGKRGDAFPINGGKNRWHRGGRADPDGNFCDSGYWRAPVAKSRQSCTFRQQRWGGSLNITSSFIPLLLLLLVYFILGFLLYATLFAAMGALVKRQDEAQDAVQPLTWLFMVGYFVSFFGIYSPDATWVRVISYIPFWTPTTMLMRIGVAMWPGGRLCSPLC